MKIVGRLWVIILVGFLVYKVATWYEGRIFFSAMCCEMSEKWENMEMDGITYYYQSENTKQGILRSHDKVMERIRQSDFYNEEFSSKVYCYDDTEKTRKGAFAFDKTYSEVMGYYTFLNWDRVRVRSTSVGVIAHELTHKMVRNSHIRIRKEREESYCSFIGFREELSSDLMYERLDLKGSTKVAYLYRIGWLYSYTEGAVVMKYAKETEGISDRELLDMTDDELIGYARKCAEDDGYRFTGRNIVFVDEYVWCV